MGDKQPEGDTTSGSVMPRSPLVRLTLVSWLVRFVSFPANMAVLSCPHSVLLTGVPASSPQAGRGDVPPPDAAAAPCVICHFLKEIFVPFPHFLMYSIISLY